MQDQIIRLYHLIRTPKYYPIFVTTLLLLISTLTLLGVMKERTLVIDRTDVVLHKGPSTTDTALKTLSKGESVELLKENKGWLKVRENEGKEGWLPKWMLELTDINDDRDIGATLLEDNFLYAESSERSEKLAPIPKGEAIRVEAESLGWIQVNYEDQIGFIPTRAVQLIPAFQLPQSIQKDPKEEEDHELEHVVVMRNPNQSLYAEADLTSEIVYSPIENEKFTFIDTAYDEFDNEFYLVEAEGGIRGFADSSYMSFAKLSADRKERLPGQALKDLTILLDPGHGGVDPGAESQDGQHYEKDSTLATGLLLKQVLENQGAEVIMTREDDSFLELSTIVDISNRSDADLFISIHFDGSHETDLEGTTTYFYHPQDEGIARAINQEISKLALENNGTHFGNYQVIRENEKPAILLELGYITNNNDLKHLLSEDYRLQVANAIMTGIDNYLKSQP